MMQSINLTKRPADIVESKVSHDAECGAVNHEVAALRRQAAGLSEIIVNLEDTVRIRDAQLENARREKGRLLADLKRQRRCNRSLQQQLDDNRSFCQCEKDCYTEETQRCRGRCAVNTWKSHQRRHEEPEVALRTENKRLTEELMDKNEITYNLCIKFLRMKHAKDTVRQKLDQLLHEHLLVMAETMEKLDEARQELNLIVSEKFQEPLPLSKAKFLQVVQRNNRLMYENATLKMQVHQCTRSIEKLKSQVQRPKKINVDARIIEKLSQTQSTTTRSVLDRSEKVPALSRLSPRVADYPEAAGTETISEAGSRNVNNYALNDARDVERSDSRDFYMERAQSAPGIVESTASRQNG